MWWNKQLDATRADLVAVLKLEVAVLRTRHEKDLERVDRLMEALARKANVDLVMPQSPLPQVERTIVSNPWKDPNLVTDKFATQEKK
jgi:hypothetical protein